MEIVHVVIAAIALAAGAAVATRNSRQRRSFRALADVASALAFRITERTEEGGAAEGRVEGTDARIDIQTTATDATISIGVHAPRTFGPSVRIALDPRQPIGLESDLGTTAAYVDGELLAIAEGAHFFSVDRGNAVLHWKYGAIPGYGQLPIAMSIRDRLERLARWARHSESEAPTIQERLAEKAMHNPDADTRFRALRALRTCYPSSEAARHARRAGLDDPAPAVRVEAATRLGPEGVQTLAAVVRDTRIAGRIRVRAMDRLAAETPKEVLRRVLFDVAFDPHHDVSIGALNRLSTCADDMTAGRIIAMARFRELDAEPMVALANFLGARGGDDAAELCLSLLQVRSEPQVIVAAAEAAIEIGPHVAARAMTILKDRPRLHGTREARRALDRLRAAIGDSGRGGLAFTGPEDGRLSVSEAEKGSVSAPEDE